jgi:hypothetical protein
MYRASCLIAISSRSLELAMRSFVRWMRVRNMCTSYVVRTLLCLSILIHDDAKVGEATSEENLALQVLLCPPPFFWR